jgi:hypothetical protein
MKNKEIPSGARRHSDATLAPLDATSDLAQPAGLERDGCLESLVANGQDHARTRIRKSANQRNLNDEGGRKSLRDNAFDPLLDL